MHLPGSCGTANVHVAAICPRATVAYAATDYGAMGTNTAFLGMADTVDGAAKKVRKQLLTAAAPYTDCTRNEGVWV
eukprot:3020284-Rhodomonas_salina.2